MLAFRKSTSLFLAAGHFVVAAAIVLAGAWASGRAHAQAPLVGKRLDEASAGIRIIGNSLSFRPADPSIGWKGPWGMAASAPSNDYAHRVASALGLPLMVFNAASLEFDPGHAQAHVDAVTQAIDRNRMVILQLGDNVRAPDALAFARGYELLLSRAKGRQLFCISTWWKNPAFDEGIRQRCEAAGGTYVYIGDIYADPRNPDRKVVGFSDPGVDAHPKDWGMERIAERIVKAAQSPAAGAANPHARP